MLSDQSVFAVKLDPDLPLRKLPKVLGARRSSKGQVLHST